MAHRRYFNVPMNNKGNVLIYSHISTLFIYLCVFLRSLCPMIASTNLDLNEIPLPQILHPLLVLA